MKKAKWAEAQRFYCMCPRGIPVVLVHGWKSHPGIWNRLIPRLGQESLECWNFSHAGMRDAPLHDVAAALQEYVATRREERGYSGPLDMVCHSMGGVIARYLLEVLDGDARSEPVRQLIQIGSPNNGSSMAELFHDPEHGEAIIRQLAGVFVPAGYDPSRDPIVQDFRPKSRAMARLRDAGTRDDVAYRMILAANRTATPDLFPCFGGRTWEIAPGGAWRLTYHGDGVVPHSDSYLSGAGFDILPADPAELVCAPGRYCHVRLPRNTEAIERILEYLRDPDTRPQAFCPGSGTSE